MRTAQRTLYLVSCVLIAATVGGILLVRTISSESRSDVAGMQKADAGNQCSADAGYSDTTIIRRTVLQGNGKQSGARSDTPDHASVAFEIGPGAFVGEAHVVEMQKLTAQIRENPAAFADVFKRFQEEKDPEMLALLAQALADNARAAGDNLPVKELLEMALHGDSAAKKEAALFILSRAATVTPEMMQVVSGITKNSQTPEGTRLAAIEAMNGWMARNQELREPVCLELADTIRTAPDHASVRAVAIQTIANMDAPLTGKVYETMVESLKADTRPNNRALAALGLSGGVTPETKKNTLAELEAAYRRETDLDTRRIILTHIARAGLTESLGLIASLPADHPNLRQDIGDYLELLKSGNVTDFNQVYDQKAQLDVQRGTIVGAEAHNDHSHGEPKENHEGHNH